MDASWIPIASFLATLFAIPSLFAIVWKDIHDRKKENSEKRKEEKKKEFQDNVREVIRSENKPIKESIDDMSKKMDLISNGTLCSLRNTIKNCYYDCLNKGYRNDYDFENIHALFKAYKDLDGNSFIEDIMNRFDKLPSKDEYMRRKKEEENSIFKGVIAPKPTPQIRVQKVAPKATNKKGGASDGK